MYKINIEQKTVQPIDSTSLEELKLQERYDLQQWIRKNPEILSRLYEYELKIISEEYDGFEVNDRLDLLAIDETGALVIIELKRKDSGSRIDIQGLKYASYCSTLSSQEIVDIYRKYLEKNNIKLDPVEDIISFISNESPTSDEIAKLNENQKIILVSQNFDSRVKSVVAYLFQKQIDISCVEFKVFKDDKSDNIFIDTLKTIPPEDINDYFIKGISTKDNIKQKNRKLVDQPPEVLTFLKSIKKGMQENHNLYARGMPHVKYQTFKTGKSGLHFAFEIMKKNKRYKVNLISKKPEYKLVERFEKMQSQIPLIQGFEYEVVRSEEGKSDWERVMFFAGPKNYLKDSQYACDLIIDFMKSMESIRKEIMSA